MSGRLENEKKVNQQIHSIIENMPEYVDEWNLHMIASNKTSETRHLYIHIISLYIKSINEQTRTVAIEDLTYESVINFLEQTKTKNKKEA